MGRCVPWALVLTVGAALAESDEAPLKLLRFEHDLANVEVDGRLSEAVWAQVSGTEEFRVIIPDSLARPR